MKTRHVKTKEHGSYVVKLRQDEQVITCPACGWEMELWSAGDDETRCAYCGHRFFRRETTVH